MRRLALWLPVFLFLAGSGCVRYKELINLREAELVYNRQQDVLNQLVVRIQPEDVLDIRVYSTDEKAAAPFNRDSRVNTQVNVNQGINNNRPRRILSGYRVDESGNISFPLLGEVRLGGLTLSEARQELIARLATYLKDPEVNVQFINFRVTLLGELNVPGSLNMPTDKTTIFEAIGQAGDMTPYANRKNVLVMREVNGKREFGRLDLQSEQVFQSPYYYLAQNDVIYIEPLKVRQATVADPFGRALGYTTAVISLAALVITLVN